MTLQKTRLPVFPVELALRTSHSLTFRFRMPDSEGHPTTEEILETARAEAQEAFHTIGYIPSPKSKAMIEANRPGRPLSVFIERVHDPFRKKFNTYLIVKVDPDRWNEEFHRINLAKKRLDE